MWWRKKNEHKAKDFDEEDFKELQRLHIVLGRRIDSPFAGEYRSAFRGQGMEFEDVRPYVPGDEIRRIDWNVTARVGTPYIKEFRESRELSLILVLDVSASMRFGQEREKRKQMARVAGALAYSAIRSGDRVGLLRFSDHIELWLPPKKSRGHVWKIIQESFRFSGEGKGSDLLQVRAHLQRVLKRRAVVCFLSDFLLSGIDDLRILKKKHDLHAFLFSDKAEQSLKGMGLCRIQDMESGRQVLVDSSAVKQRWGVEERVGLLRQSGILTSTLDTGEDPLPQLLAHFRKRRFG
ncbi:MAG: DUF58 domain-containing protein [Proteobacteria bacterium]|nr:DUF58 domain-containing protein [Pseudomonadota bacterium]